MDQQTARTSLEQILRELDGTTQVLTGEEPEPEGELVDGPHDTVDETQELVSREQEEAMIDASADRRREVEAAIARLDGGTYGVCIDCGMPIDEARLDYRPEAARCLPDQERAEAAAS